MSTAQRQTPLTAASLGSSSSTFCSVADMGRSTHGPTSTAAYTTSLLGSSGSNRCVDSFLCKALGFGWGRTSTAVSVSLLQYGLMEITCRKTHLTSALTFKQAGWFFKDLHRIEGFVYDKQ